jgi:uncharacterized protein (TIGR02996 family)
VTRQTALLDEIWKRPDDRELLSVYADYLASVGETTRAEYIQLSLQEPRSAAQDKRRDALRNKHRGAWLGVARQFVHTWEESEDTPGFIARAKCSTAKLTEGFEHVRALGPRLAVAVTEPKAKRETVALAKLPLGSLYGLALYEADAQWITDELLATLAPTLRGLRALVLRAGEARATDEGWQTVLANLDAVEHLDLTMGWNPERWLELLLASPLARTLRTLSVPGWIGKPLRKRLNALPCTIDYRDERRSRYNRETGYYETW